MQKDQFSSLPLVISREDIFGDYLIWNWHWGVACGDQTITTQVIQITSYHSLYLGQIKSYPLRTVDVSPVVTDTGKWGNAKYIHYEHFSLFHAGSLYNTLLRILLSLPKPPIVLVTGIAGWRTRTPSSVTSRWCHRWHHITSRWHQARPQLRTLGVKLWICFIVSCNKKQGTLGWCFAILKLNHHP